MRQRRRSICNSAWQRGDWAGSRALNQDTRDPNIVSEVAQSPGLPPCIAVWVKLSGNANTNNVPPRVV